MVISPNSSVRLWYNPEEPCCGNEFTISIPRVTFDTQLHRSSLMSPLSDNPPLIPLWKTNTTLLLKAEQFCRLLLMLMKRTSWSVPPSSPFSNPPYFLNPPPIHTHWAYCNWCFPIDEFRGARGPKKALRILHPNRALGSIQCTYPFELRILKYSIKIIINVTFQNLLAYMLYYTTPI